MSTDELLQQILQLPVHERAGLAQRLLDSLEEPSADVDAAWVPELERRSREIAEGKVKTIPWEVVRAEIDEDLRRLREDRLSS